MRLWGLHVVRAALANPDRRARGLWLTQNARNALADVISGDMDARVEVCDRRALDALAPPDAVHQGAVLEADPLPAAPLELLTGLAGPATVLALDQVTDPRNVGAVLRSAALFGAAGVVVTDRHAPRESGALAKAAAGALDLVPVARVANLARALDDLKSAGYWLVGLDADAAQSLGDFAPPDRVALVLGAEGKGIRRLTAESCDILIKIKTSNSATNSGIRVVESLNVSNAAAVTLYELTRNRRELL